MRKRIIKRVRMYNVILVMLVFVISVLASGTKPHVEAFSRVVDVDVVGRTYISCNVKEDRLETDTYSVEELAFINARDNDPNFYNISYGKTDTNDISSFNLDDAESDNDDEEADIQEESVVLEDPEIVAMKDNGEDVPEVSDHSVKIFESEALSAELQWYAKDLCEKNNIDLEIFMSLMWRESRYDAGAIGGGRDYGLCQIRDSNHAHLKDKLGVSNFLDPKENIQAGVYMLADSMRYYEGDSIHLSLMVYNGGPGYAHNLINSGKYSSEYSRAIVNHAKGLGYSE